MWTGAVMLSSSMYMALFVGSVGYEKLSRCDREIEAERGCNSGLLGEHEQARFIEFVVRGVGIHWSTRGDINEIPLV
jgi:hypothetical protein